MSMYWDIGHISLGLGSDTKFWLTGNYTMSYVLPVMCILSIVSVCSATSWHYLLIYKKMAHTFLQVSNTFSIQYIYEAHKTPTPSFFTHGYYLIFILSLRGCEVRRSFRPPLLIFPPLTVPSLPQTTLPHLRPPQPAMWHRTNCP